MSERGTERDDARPPQLAIDGIPARMAGLAAGMIYAIAFDQQGLRVALVARTLDRALQEGRPCVWVSPLEPAMLMRKAALAGTSLDPHLRAGRLTLVWQPSAADPQFARVRAWSDLAATRVVPGSLVVLDPADERFGLGDASGFARALGAGEAWLARTGCSLLATFVQGGPVAARESPSLGALAEHLAGFAVVHAVDAGNAVLDVRHWFGDAGMLARACYALTLRDDGSLAARAATFGAEPSLPTSDEVTVITRRAAVGLGELPARWIVADEFLSVLDACRDVRAGTVVLHFDRASALREVGQTVALLRASGKPQLRVMVRECGARLRFAQSVALMRLGVSQVVPREASGASARLMVESLAGAVFTRPVETQLARVLAQSHAYTDRRLLPVDDFRSRVDQLLTWCAEVDLPATLVRFSMVSPQALKAAIGALQRGARDCVFAEHDGSIWILLFGCQPDDADSVLSRLLGARYESLLAGMQRIGGVARIRHAMRLLDHAVVDSADAVFADTVVRLDDGAPGGA